MYHKEDVERCPKCKSIYIQYDEYSDECYCLNKECGNRWEADLDFHNIKNPYLRTSIKRIPA
jgi:hypothetical protein